MGNERPQRPSTVPDRIATAKILGVSRLPSTDRSIARTVRAEIQLKASKGKARHARAHPPFAQSARLQYPAMAIPTPNTAQTAKHRKSPLGALNRAPTQAIPSQQPKDLSADLPPSQAGLCANASRKPALFRTAEGGCQLELGAGGYNAAGDTKW